MISRKFLRDSNVELKIKNKDELVSEDDLSIEDKDIKVSRDEENTIRLSLDR